MAAATAAGSVRAGSYCTTALPRARLTRALETPPTLRAAFSTWATQLAQSMPVTEKVASASAGACVGGEADILRDYTLGGRDPGLRCRFAPACGIKRGPERTRALVQVL